MTDDDDDDIQEAVLDTEPAPQATPDPTPTPSPAAAPEPSPATTPEPGPAPTTPPASQPTKDDWEDDDDDDEYYGFMDNIYEKMTLGPIPGKITFYASVSLVVILFLVASIVSPSIGLFKGVGKVTITLGDDDYSDMDNEELSFDAFISPPKLGILDMSDGEYKIIYDGDVVTSGKISFNSNRKGTITVPTVDYYVDNGRYEVKVTASGTSESEYFTAYRTVKVIEPIGEIRYDQQEEKEDEDRANDYMNIDPGFKISGEAKDAERPVWTRGTGTIEIYYCSDGQGPGCGNAELRETITLEMNFISWEWTIESDQSTDDGQISIYREYWDDDDNDDGWYNVEVEFTNEFSEHDDADTELKEGELENWINDDRDSV